MDRVVPPIRVPGFDEKLAHFAGHKDDYDTLFFGSSRVYHQIMVPLFDRLTGEGGQPTNSFNFGLDGLMAPETSYVAERLFATQPGKLKWVFIEISFFRNDWTGREPDSARALHWHDGRRLGLVFEELFTTYKPMSFEDVVRSQPPPVPEPSKPPRKKARKMTWAKRWKNLKSESDKKWTDAKSKWNTWRMACETWWRTMGQPPGLSSRVATFGTHLRLWMNRSLNLGRGSKLVAAWGGNDFEKGDPTALGPRGDGVAVSPRVRVGSKEVLAKFDRLLAEQLANPSVLLTLSQAQEDDLQTVLRLVREAGAEPILFISPDVMPCRRFSRLEPQLPLFDFSRPDQFPQLFQRGHRSDLSHLNALGAPLFTGEMARLFLELRPPKRVP